MTYQGTVQNGVIVFGSSLSFPEGTVVEFTPRSDVAACEKPKTIGERLAELADWAETQPCDLPSDLAKNHDHYLHGLPKQE